VYCAVAHCIATVSRLSIRPLFARLSVTFMYRGHISRVVRRFYFTRIISLRSFAPRCPKSGNLVQWGNSDGADGIGVGSLFSTENLQYLSETGQVGPRLMTILGSCIYAHSIGTKTMTLDDPEGLLRTLFQNTCVFGAHHENLNEDRPTLSGEDVTQ